MPPNLMPLSSNPRPVTRPPVRASVLYLVHRVPFPPDKGDRIRNFHILKFLSTFADVHLACLADEPLALSADSVLNTYCSRWHCSFLNPVGRRFRSMASIATGATFTEGAFYSANLLRVLQQWGSMTDYSAIVLSSSAMLQYLDLAVLKNTPAIVDLIDVDSEKWLEYSRSGPPVLKWIYALEGQRLRQVERSLRPNVAAIVVVSENEAALYRSVCGDGPVRAIGNGVDFSFFERQALPPANQLRCVFAGAMDYRPNVDAALLFSHAVWPAIRAAIPQAQFVIVGRNPVKAVRQLCTIPGVEVTGTVPDVRPWYANAAVAVAPLRMARGVQNKVLESMAMHLPTVVSSQALAGLSAIPESEVLVADTPEQWQLAVRRLLDDSELRQRVGQAGRQYVERNHSWELRLAPLRTLIENTMHDAISRGRVRQPT
jgi:polysaccharide biosynthesis protein PslH